MCDQRERLIGYLYEEGDAAERAVVQAHLDECADCRAEIAGFRSVQNDLRAWDVPDHESVWRPFAPAPAPQWWQQVPRWALAAAAGLMLMSGATGGAVAYLVMPEPSPEVVVQAPQAPILQNTSSVTAGDLAAAEARVMERMRIQFAALETSGRVMTASSNIPGDESRLRQLEQAVAAFSDGDARLRAVESQMTDIRLKAEEQLGIAAEIYANQKFNRNYIDIQLAGVKNSITQLNQLIGTNK